ncbi:hypothetical protein QBC34DRAFT_458852 [Podospora aff. communis PSN243]|uniref:Uncharacterized protein n=1 Tax=Podospora aff. communis PSN243 TaxID=3040156 RepID=A0AAV9GV45_9PEZI|nr:hypothetical protein QBC34DRAFT_458852 [Podospora aff. communis PSN243]
MQLLTLFVATAALITPIAADFHLLYSDWVNSNRRDFFTCPSNYWTNKCWCNGDRRSNTAFWSEQSNGQIRLKLKKVCGVAEVDFWWRPSGVSGDSRVRWQAYIPNADGRVVATCYNNGERALKPDCNLGLLSQNRVYDGWVCYSAICGSA